MQVHHKLPYGILSGNAQAQLPSEEEQAQAQDVFATAYVPPSDKSPEKKDNPAAVLEGAFLYRLDPAPTDKDKDAAEPTAVGTIGKDGKISWKAGVDGAAESKLFRAHPDRYAVAGADFAKGAQTFTFDPVGNPQHLAGATVAALQGMGERGMYASIDEGKLYVKVGNQIQEFHFASGCGAGVNNVACENMTKRGPCPAGSYTVQFKEHNYHGRGYDGYSITENGSTKLHNGRTDIMIHPLGASGMTWGCLGVPPQEMAQLQHVLGSGAGAPSWRLTVGNTHQSQPVYAAHRKPSPNMRA